MLAMLRTPRRDPALSLLVICIELAWRMTRSTHCIIEEVPLKTRYSSPLVLCSISAEAKTRDSASYAQSLERSLQRVPSWYQKIVTPETLDPK